MSYDKKKYKNKNEAQSKEEFLDQIKSKLGMYSLAIAAVSLCGQPNKQQINK